MANVTTPTEDRAKKLLGQGLSVSVVASTLGVTDSRISQLMADSTFAAEVQKLRFETMQQSTEIDDQYNSMEDRLLKKLDKVLPLINKPKDILQAINTINGAKRRGQAAPDSTNLAAKVVNLQLPVAIQQQFITNVNKQITEVRDGSGHSQTLVTASSGSLDGFVKQRQAPQQPQLASQGVSESDSAEVTSEGSDESGSSKTTSTLADSL